MRTSSKRSPCSIALLALVGAAIDARLALRPDGPRARLLKTAREKNKFYSCFDVVIKIGKKRVLKNLMTPLLGKHNVLNTLCSYSVAKGLKVPDYKIKNALRNFMGVKRRFSILYNDSRNMIIDDYAHHPNEIRTTLNSLKCITKKKLITI